VPKNEYIILRRSFVLKSGDQGGSDRDDAHAIAENKRRGPPPPPLTVTSLDERDAEDLRRDPELLLAPSVPLSLIHPLAGDDEEDEKAVQAARANGTSWGVREVAPVAAPGAGSATTVAVLDSGIDTEHPAFRGVNLTRENFSDSPNDCDVLGHGTHCAGTIFGRDVEGVRIGIARGVRDALIAKVLDDKGEGNTAVFARAIQWSLENGARVISMSLGLDFNRLFKHLEHQGHPRDQAFSRALSQYRDTVRFFDEIVKSMNASGVVLKGGATVVAAAGNESRRRGPTPCIVDVSLPGAALGVVSVGAVQKDANGYEIAPFSNGNPAVWAPGVGIVSAKAGGGLVSKQGTSMAAPHVAGAAILWCERTVRTNPRAGPELWTAKLMAGGRTEGFSSAVSPAERGAGLVQAPP
jgi:subtilisin family serine protease